jgi:hypothetical protein
MPVNRHLALVWCPRNNDFCSTDGSANVMDAVAIKSVPGSSEAPMKTSLLSKLSILVLSGIVFADAVSARADALDNWTADFLSVTNGSANNGGGLIGVAYGNGRYVAVGQFVTDDTGMHYTSEDGVNWTWRNPNPFVDGMTDVYDVAYANGLFVAVGWGGLGNPCLYTSTDGITWSSRTNGLIANFFRVIYGGGLFVAVGDGQLWQNFGVLTNRNIYTSANGTNWVARLSGAPANDARGIGDVAYGAGRFVAVDGAGHFHTSVSGATWFRATNNLAGGYVSFCNGLFFVPCGAGSNLVSADGLTWSVLTNNTGSLFGRVVYSSGTYLALASPAVFTSTDGTNWIERNLSAPANPLWRSVVFGPLNAVIVGYTQSAFPVVPLAYTSGPFAALRINGGLPPQLNVSGLSGRSCRIDYTTNLLGAPSEWVSATTLLLTNNPVLWTDLTATNSQRFYRGVLLP